MDDEIALDHSGLMYHQRAYLYNHQLRDSSPHVTIDNISIYMLIFILICNKIQYMTMQVLYCKFDYTRVIHSFKMFTNNLEATLVGVQCIDHS